MEKDFVVTFYESECCECTTEFVTTGVFESVSSLVDDWSETRCYGELTRFCYLTLKDMACIEDAIEKADSWLLIRERGNAGFSTRKLTRRK